MTNLLDKLGPRQRKGSKPRCHWLTHGSAAQVADRLTSMIEPWGEVSETDRWMPEGFDNITEAQLHDAPRLLDRDKFGNQLRDWWLAVTSPLSMTPNFDIASTCQVIVGDKSEPGLLLVEAKAHDRELINVEAGKQLKPPKGGALLSVASRRNHVRIGASIQDANLAMAGETGLPWALSRDWNYQMSNRFAWSWKLTELGFPVILVYLGFLNAEEMKGDNREPFASADAWATAVKNHSAGLFPESVWDRPWSVIGQRLIPLIQSREIAHDRPIGKVDSGSR